LHQRERRDIESYVCEFYHADKHKVAYEGIILPIPDSSTWEKVQYIHIYPPHDKRGVGRPKKKRKKGPDKPKNKIILVRQAHL